MSSEDVLHTIAVYLKGDELIPEQLTAVLGVQPTESHRKGDSSVSRNGKNIVKSTGLWKLAVTTKAPLDLPLALEGITSQLMTKDLALAELPGVEESFVDVFIAKVGQTDGSGTCEFLIDRASLNALDQLALPIQFTVTVVRN